MVDDSFLQVIFSPFWREQLVLLITSDNSMSRGNLVFIALSEDEEVEKYVVEMYGCNETAAKQIVAVVGGVLEDLHLSMNRACDFLEFKKQLFQIVEKKIDNGERKIRNEKQLNNSHIEEMKKNVIKEICFVQETTPSDVN